MHLQIFSYGKFGEGLDKLDDIKEEKETQILFILAFSAISMAHFLF